MLIDRRAHERNKHNYIVILLSCILRHYSTKVYISVVILMLAEWEEDKKSHWLDPVSRREQPYMN